MAGCMEQGQLAASTTLAKLRSLSAGPMSHQRGHGEDHAGDLVLCNERCHVIGVHVTPGLGNDKGAARHQGGHDLQATCSFCSCAHTTNARPREHALAHTARHGCPTWSTCASKLMVLVKRTMASGPAHTKPASCTVGPGVVQAVARDAPEARPPGSSLRRCRSTSQGKRSCRPRWGSTQPLGRPVEPLVKMM